MQSAQRKEWYPQGARPSGGGWLKPLASLRPLPSASSRAVSTPAQARQSYAPPYPAPEPVPEGHAEKSVSLAPLAGLPPLGYLDPFRTVRLRPAQPRKMTQTLHMPGDLPALQPIRDLFSGYASAPVTTQADDTYIGARFSAAPPEAVFHDNDTESVQRTLSDPFAEEPALDEAAFPAETPEAVHPIEAEPAQAESAAVAAEEPALDEAAFPAETPEAVHPIEAEPAQAESAAVAAEEPALDEAAFPAEAPEAVHPLEAEPAQAESAAVAAEEPALDEAVFPAETPEAVHPIEAEPAQAESAAVAAEEPALDEAAFFAETPEAVRPIEAEPAQAESAAVAAEEPALDEAAFPAEAPEAVRPIEAEPAQAEPAAIEAEKPAIDEVAFPAEAPEAVHPIEAEPAQAEPAAVAAEEPALDEAVFPAEASEAVHPIEAEPVQAEPAAVAAEEPALDEAAFPAEAPETFPYPEAEQAAVMPAPAAEETLSEAKSTDGSRMTAAAALAAPRDDEATIVSAPVAQAEESASDVTSENYTPFVLVDGDDFGDDEEPEPVGERFTDVKEDLPEPFPVSVNTPALIPKPSRKSGKHRFIVWFAAVAFVAAVGLALYQSGLIAQLLPSATPLPTTEITLPSTGDVNLGTVRSTPLITATPSVLTDLRSVTVEPAEAAAPVSLRFTMETNASTTSVRLMTDNGDLLHTTAYSAPEGDGLSWQVTTEMDEPYTGNIRIFLRDQDGTWNEASTQCQVTVN